MNSAIVTPYPGYPKGALSYPKAVRRDGDSVYAKATNGVIYHVAERINGYYPIRSEVATATAQYRAIAVLFATPLAELEARA